ncbi:Tap42 interacting protein [Malassezia sp. CBS 17886]|nr:Tap42 interacting protein [Malassezia sp. CBS 17886]
MATRHAGTPGTGRGTRGRLFENVLEVDPATKRWRPADRPPAAASSGPAAPSPSDHVLQRGIHTGPWTVEVLHGSIANAAEVEALSELLEIPPPEMPFPRNALVLRHAPTAFTYIFDATRALQCVDSVCEDRRRSGVDCCEEAERMGARPRRLSGMGIKVAYASEWGRSRRIHDVLQSTQPVRDQSTRTDGPPSGAIASAKQYDWTYSSTWPGTAGCTAAVPLFGAEETACGDWDAAFHRGTDPARDRIPVERLGPGSGQPILFYDDVVLYEDELGDNGSSMLNVKVRVMPNEFLVLQRFFLRVDDVVFRIFDTRIYCSFVPSDGEPLTAAERAACGPGAPTHWPRIVRECRGAEVSYADVKQYRPDDMSPLTDVNWVAETLERLQQRRAAVPRTDCVSPAAWPTATPGGGTASGAVLGEVPEADAAEANGRWAGDGHRVDVAVLRGRVWGGGKGRGG